MLCLVLMTYFKANMQIVIHFFSNFDDTYPEFWKVKPKCKANVGKSCESLALNKNNCRVGINGFDAVEIFLKDKHLGKARFLYMNYKDDKNYRFLL